MEYLELDATTLKDLEIFECDKGGISLFEFCNQTRSKGGELRLRARMEKPWSDASRILATQASLGFINAYPQAFDKRPNGFTTTCVEDYLHGILPYVSHSNFIEFTMGAWSLWAANDRCYYEIIKGVRIGCKFIHSLRNFVAQFKSLEPLGELAEILAEMNTLLGRPAIAGLPDTTTEFGLFRELFLLRIDQTFRVRESDTLQRLLALVYELDALSAMAETMRLHNFGFPEIASGDMAVIAEGLVHPYVDNAVPNPVELNQQHRGLFLTGPNMGGKTTYLRAFALGLYFAHLGMGVPARSFRFVPIEKLYSSISLSDNLHHGVSYFKAEALRVKEVSQAIVDGHKVVAIMDEPFKGTNVKDTLEASLAILNYFAARSNALFMFSSHQVELRGELEKAEMPIDCRCFSAVEDEEFLRFDFKLRPGVSSQRIGMRVLSEVGVFSLFA